MPVVTRLADVITTWGDALARVHPGALRLGDRCMTVYPPVDLAEFRPRRESRDAARAKLELAGHSPVVGSLGVLNPQKGHEYFIEAAARIRADYPGALFRILGTSSPAHESYERALRTKVAELGLESSLRFVDPGPRAAELLQGLDVFALTSVPRSEGMPTAILEAMACAKPVVATDVGAVRELVSDGSTGVVVPAENPAAIADAICSLLADDRRRATLGENGLTAANERFSLEHLADLHARAYAIADHRRGSEP